MCVCTFQVNIFNWWSITAWLFAGLIQNVCTVHQNRILSGEISGILNRGLHSRMPFPGNQIFPIKIWEISDPELSGTSSSQSWLSTWHLGLASFRLVSGRETFRNSRTLPEWKNNHWKFWIILYIDTMSEMHFLNIVV